MGLNNKQKKIFEERSNYDALIVNYQGCKMKCIKYNSSHDIEIEFQDEYKAIVHTGWKHFIEGSVKNPYYKSVCNYGVVGLKYPVTINGETIKEYTTWHSIKYCVQKIKISKIIAQLMRMLIYVVIGYYMKTFMNGYMLKKILISG